MDNEHTTQQGEHYKLFVLRLWRPTKSAEWQLAITSADEPRPRGMPTLAALVDLLQEEMETGNA